MPHLNGEVGEGEGAGLGVSLVAHSDQRGFAVADDRVGDLEGSAFDHVRPPFGSAFRIDLPIVSHLSVFVNWFSRLRGRRLA